MISLILSNWKVLAASIATAGLAFLLHSVAVVGINAKHDSELKTQRETLLAEFNEKTKITEGVSNEYQVKIASLRRQLASAKRVQPRCVMPVTAAPDGHHAATGGGQPSNPHGIRSEWLLDYASEAEEYRLRLISCQNFIGEVWK